MDSARAIRLLAAAIALLFVAAAAPQPLLLREQAWAASRSNLAGALTQAPGECLVRSGDAIERGRALFRSPALLGGPAARAGLSCHACHSNGRSNADFLLPELTDRPGAADVTSEWSSRVRGDGLLNPVDIPDLAGVAQREAFGRNRDQSLEHFVRGVIVDEFQGQEPPEQALASLLAYLSALDSSACGEVMHFTLQVAADDVRRSLAAAVRADAPTAALLILSAQDGLARIAERLPRDRYARDRRALEQFARELGRWRENNFAAALETGLPGWRARFDAAVARIARYEQRTYFNPVTLERALTEQR